MTEGRQDIRISGNQDAGYQKSRVSETEEGREMKDEGRRMAEQQTLNIQHRTINSE